MAPISVHLRAPGWIQGASGTSCIGTLYHKGQRLPASAAILDFAKIGVDAEDWNNWLSASHGFFAAVRYEGSKLCAAVDRVRAIPLFYAQTDRCFFLSDDAEWVRSSIGADEIDPAAADELLLTGYVTGADTLFSAVRQLQAGEIISVVDRGGLQVVTQRYYRFLRQELADWDEAELTDRLDDVVLACHRRLVEVAAGRPIAIPLSGGLDSRLIAMTLKRLGYSNIVAFTYGIADNKESITSRLVAERLRIPWYFVPYSNRRWRAWFDTPERRAFYRVGSGWASLPHTQDWPAVWELARLGHLPADALIVPGHSGDFIAGSHLPAIVAKPGFMDNADLNREIWRANYLLCSISATMYGCEDALFPRISSRLVDLPPVKTSVDLAAAFECWDWQERQAKYIVNSVRVYDFWGRDWWMPLWDGEFMDFWTTVPLALRWKTRWYSRYVQDRYGELVGAPVKPQRGSLRGHTYRLLLDRAPLDLRRVLMRIARRLGARSHPMAFYGRFPAEFVRRSLAEGMSLNGLSARYFLHEIEGEFRRNDEDRFDVRQPE